MKYYQMFIHFENSFETYNAITLILNITPTPDTPSRFSPEIPNLWFYMVEEKFEDPNYDFINNFLDIIEPKYNELAKLRITKKDINFWLLYEYDQQCAMEFHPQELKRLGESGIVLCIDCWQQKDDDSKSE